MPERKASPDTPASAARSLLGRSQLSLERAASPERSSPPAPAAAGERSRPAEAQAAQVVRESPRSRRFDPLEALAQGSSARHIRMHLLGSPGGQAGGVALGEGEGAAAEGAAGRTIPVRTFPQGGGPAGSYKWL